VRHQSTITAASWPPNRSYTGFMEDEIHDARDGSGELETVVAFLNTADQRRYSRHGIRQAGGDALVTAAALSAWLAEHDLVPASSRASRADLARARELREALRTVLLLQADKSADQRLVRRADATLATLPMQVRIGESGTPRLMPTGKGISAAVASIAVAVAQAEARGTWRRVKMCAAADCHWVFFDASRNGGGRWCSMAVCGNRDKTSKYRQRHLASADDRSGPA
jgi:predicted RNA-binding Zn ribbon-like protein